MKKMYFVVMLTMLVAHSSRVHASPDPLRTGGAGLVSIASALVALDIIPEYNRYVLLVASTFCLSEAIGAGLLIGSDNLRSEEIAAGALSVGLMAGSCYTFVSPQRRKHCALAMLAAALTMVGYQVFLN